MMTRVLAAALLLATTSIVAAAPDREFFTPWIVPAERTRLHNVDIAFRDQDDRGGVIASLLNKPVVITFFYTRCQNGRKCSMAVSRMAALQRQLTQAGIADQVRLLAISYEPQFDTPDRIHRYAADRGMRLSENARALQLDAARIQGLVDELGAPANYNAGWINTHGVQLTLLDREGRMVRLYHTLLWDNDQVMKDLRRVLTEH